MPQTRDVLFIELGATKNTFQGNRWQRQAVLKGPWEPAPGAQAALWGRGPGGVLPACRVLPARLTVTTGSLNFCAEWRSSPFPGPLWPRARLLENCGPGVSRSRVRSAASGVCGGRAMPEARFRSGAGRSGRCPQPPGLCCENPSTPGVGRTPWVARGRGLWLF